MKIRKIRLINFKRFRDYTIEPNDRINILVGDNEVGKSSTLEAIDLVASGNKRRIEILGLDKLINVEAVREFTSGERVFEKLPELRIELYIALQTPNHTMNGKNNADKVTCDGIRLVCAPNKEYRAEIKAALEAHPNYFPYEYYSSRFSTFADEEYTGYKKKLRSVFIDSTSMNSDYATNDFVRRMYRQYTETNVKERARHKSNYRVLRDSFQNDSLAELNTRISGENNYSFGLRGGNAIDLESELMIYEDNVGIDSKGTGRQVFVKTDLALGRSGDNVNVVLIEEPENHLSPTNLRKLVHRVLDTRGGQLFITTHNNYISTRLELQNLVIMHASSGEKPIMLKDLREETAKYFMKTPPASIVEFALASKVILVEGPAEFMLIERFYMTVTGHQPEDDGVQIIDIRGLSFLRYLEIAKLTKGKVGVITDNDNDAKKNCIEKYSAYANDSNIKVFYEPDNEKRTFEIVLYSANSDLCNSLFRDDAQEYMLKNKTEAAFAMLSQKQPIVVPDYIKRAIEWIKE